MGNTKNISHAELLDFTRHTYPDAQIIFKPHPLDLQDSRASLTEIVGSSGGVKILDSAVSLPQALETIDRVVTIASVGGFEAALRGIPVTVLGAPFYAGWGFTDDVSLIERRTRQLSPLEVLAGAFFLYPIYIDSKTNKTIAPESMLRETLWETRASFGSPLGGATGHLDAAETISDSDKVVVIGSKYAAETLRAAFAVDDVIVLNDRASGFDQQTKTLLPAPHPTCFLLHRNARSSTCRTVRASTFPVFEIDDGFLCFSNTRTAPYSVLIDSKGAHYDPDQPSTLEELLATYDFDAAPELMTRAEALLARFLESGLSRANPYPHVENVEKVYGPKENARVLVLGFRSNDRGTMLANPQGLTHADLLRLAREEHPDAQIILRPHPLTSSAELTHLKALSTEFPNVLIADAAMPFAQALESVDHVITLASLGGFEAALRNLPVTVLGAPFYAGWSITDDRAAPARRIRKLTPLQVFAVAYILYPIYLDPIRGERATPEEVLDLLAKALAEAPSVVLTRAEERAEESSGKQKPAESTTELPNWFRPSAGPELVARLKGNAPVYLWYPWIAEHGDKLIANISDGADFVFAPFDLVEGISELTTRRKVGRFVRKHPDIYRKLLLRRLIPLRRNIKGFVFTFDWAPTMRIAVEVCRELDIPTILIPHEAVFVNRDKYYTDIITRSSMPLSDVILGWGGMQRDIFVERGFPNERFIAVGAPKFDAYHAFEPDLTRAQYARVFGLDPAKPIVLFVTQPLDSQVDATVARAAQRQAITDLLEVAQEMDCQILVRMPPSRDDILGLELRYTLTASGIAAIDDAQCYLVCPEEALYHADVVLSINSTMLFEGLLIGRPSISMKYLEFDQIWEKVGIPAAHNIEEFRSLLLAALTGRWRPTEQGMAWAAERFGIGSFDGQATMRIRQKLQAWTQNAPSRAPDALERLFSRATIDVAAIPSDPKILSTLQKHLPALLNIRTLISSIDEKESDAATSAEIFLQWGITPNKAKKRQSELSRELGRPVVIVEDGFIRSVEIGLSGTPALSVILDDQTAYYDATRPSRLEIFLQSGSDLTEAQRERARNAIDKIVKARVSKYNHALDAHLEIGDKDRPKLLLIDQRFGDQSVASGLASEQTFDAMLFDAVRSRPHHDIIVKQHPDAISGGKGTYFSSERLSKIAPLTKRLYPISFDVNPYALLDLADEVWVGTSGMGFEALMAGCKVRCYGMPYYAGWGVTDDRQDLKRRTRRRTVEDIFHFAWIELSRYFDPNRQKCVEVEALVDYIVEARGW